MALKDFNWLGDSLLGTLPYGGLEVAVRVRSTRPPQPALLRLIEGEPEVELLDGEYGFSPGQACVVYEDASDRARVLGGGVIRAALGRDTGLAARSSAEVASTRPAASLAR